MTNHGVFCSCVIFILHFLSFDQGFGFQTYRLCRWGATTKTNQQCHSTSSLIATTRTQSSSPFSTSILHSRNQQQLQLTKVSFFPKGEQPTEIKDWLQNRLKLTDMEIEKIYNKATVFQPRIKDGDVESAISSRIESLDNKIDFLQKRLNMTDKEISKVFTQSNTLLQYSSEAIGEKLDWLKSRLGLDDKQLSTLVRRASTLLLVSMEENVSPKLTWLQERFDLNTTQQLRTFVLRNPTILYCQIDSMEDTLTWYKNRFNFPDSEKAVKKIIRIAPQLLGRDVESVGEKLTWLQNRLDLTDVELYKLIQGCPAMLYLNVDNKLEPQLHCLASRFCLDESGLRMILFKQPTIFHLSIDNIQSTMEFYEGILGKDDAIKQIGNAPNYLTASLEGRLKPRLANVTKLGLVVGQDVPLSYFVKHTNKKWEEYITQFSK